MNASGRYDMVLAITSLVSTAHLVRAVHRTLLLCVQSPTQRSYVNSSQHGRNQKKHMNLSIFF